MKLPNAVLICFAWIFLALLFNAGIYMVEGQQKALEFLTGYILELSLSIDNLFVFYVIFSHFKVSLSDQAKILTWGILGAQLMRALFILSGIALLQHLNWVIYVFGVLLVFSGFKVLTKSNQPIHLDQNILLRFFNSFAPVQASSFLMVLILIEITDLVLALDSIPAILAVTKDPFIVYTSNILAILGLRSMYSILALSINKFHYLHCGLGVILIFVGVKITTQQLWPIPIVLTLGFILVTLSVSIFASLFHPQPRSK